MSPVDVHTLGLGSPYSTTPLSFSLWGFFSLYVPYQPSREDPCSLPLPPFVVFFLYPSVSPGGETFSCDRRRRDSLRTPICLVEGSSSTSYSRKGQLRDSDPPSPVVTSPKCRETGRDPNSSSWTLRNSIWSPRSNGGHGVTSPTCKPMSSTPAVTSRDSVRSETTSWSSRSDWVHGGSWGVGME